MVLHKTPASDAIALLIELAEKGEINPWDVQVIEIIDRFLTELGIDDSDNLALEETDLSKSGQVMLWASKLVLFKAETLERINQIEEEIETEIEAELEENRQRRNYQFDRQIKRRTSAPPPKQRKVTLQEFIAQLQAIDRELKEKTLSHDIPLKGKKKGYTRKQALKTITELAHNENLTELAEKLNLFIREETEKKEIPLEELISQWQQHQKEESPDKVGVFWALLLLSSQSKVELSQEKFYQDINIQLIL